MDLDSGVEKALEKALLGVMGKLETPRRFDFSNLTAIVAVGGMILSITNSWAVTSKRLDYLESTMSSLAAKADRVPQIEIQLDELKRTLARMESNQGAVDAKVNEIHDALIRMGIGVGNKKMGSG